MLTQIKKKRKLKLSHRTILATGGVRAIRIEEKSASWRMPAERGQKALYTARRTGLPLSRPHDGVHEALGADVRKKCDEGQKNG